MEMGWLLHFSLRMTVFSVEDSCSIVAKIRRGRPCDADNHLVLEIQLCP